MPQIRHGSTLQWINSIYNTTGGTISNSYNLTTNENGVLPSFTISLNENSEMAIITDIDPPNIILISPGNTTSLSAGTTFIWINITTDENAVCRYNLINSSFAYSDGTNFTNTGSTSHSFLYSGLSDGTTYSLYYKCNDSYGNINADSVYHVFSVSSPAQQTTTTTSSSGGGGGGGSTTTKTITVLPKNDIEKVVVNLKSALSGASVTVAKVETVPVSAPKEPVYQYINITKKNFNNSQINNATIDFKVNKSWILQNNFTMIWLARYENGWNKLKTDLLNSTATVNYYRAYTNAFSYFAIVGEKAQAAQAPAPVVEPVNENPAQQKSVNEETPKEQLTPSEPEKSKPSYVGYVIAILVIIVGVWVARSKVLHKAMKETIKEQPAPVVKNIFTKPKISRKVNSSKTKDLDDIQRRIDGIKRKSRK